MTVDGRPDESGDWESSRIQNSIGGRGVRAMMKLATVLTSWTRARSERSNMHGSSDRELQFLLPRVFMRK